MSNRRPHAFVLIYAAVFMVTMGGMVSLAVDWGRVQTAKTEIRNAADAAARYAAAGLYNGTAATNAVGTSNQNLVDSSGETVTASNVEIGTWNLASGAFVPAGTPTNAVRVTLRRTISLYFGPIIGLNSCDVVGVSVCRQSSLCAVGINSLTINGSGVVRRKSTEGGGVTAASNGAYTQAVAANSINGDAFYRGTAPAGTVTGKSVALPYNFAYAAPVTPGGVPNYGAISDSSSTFYAGGNIGVTSVALSGTATVYLTSDTNIYCSGTYTSSGNVTLVSNGYRMTVYMTAASAVTFTNNNPYTISVYAPLSDVVLNGPGTITGSVVGKTLTIKAPLEFTGLLPVPFEATGGDMGMTIGGVQTMR